MKKPFKKQLPHEEHPDLARECLAAMPQVKDIHRKIDEILAWTPEYACYGVFKFVLLQSVAHTHQAMLDDQRARKEGAA